MCAPAPHRRAALAVAVFALVASYLLYPVEADAAYAINDALWNALMASGDTEHAVSGHHPLFHIAAYYLSNGLESLGVERPGLHAVKVVSSVAGALMLALIVLASGPRRWWVGVLLAGLLASTRGFWIEAGTGENVLLGVALGMQALRVALDRDCGIARVSWWVFVALLARQDNILLLPAVTYALGQRLQPQGRWPRVVLWGGVTGVVTLATYWAIWVAFPVDMTFPEWLTHTSTHNARAVNGSWSPTGGAITPQVLEMHMGALSSAVVGLITFERTFNICIGLGFLLVIAGTGVFLRGRGRHRPLVIMTLLVFVFRVPFYLWFEPGNFEWWLLPIGVLTWAAAHAVRDDEPARGLRPILVGLALVASIVTVLGYHADHSWSLRNRTMSAAIDRVLAESRNRVRPIYVPITGVPMTAFRMRGVKPYYRVALSSDPIQALDALIKKERARTIVILVDRFVHGGMAINREIVDPIGRILDGFVAAPGGRILRRRGHLQAIILPPR